MKGQASERISAKCSNQADEQTYFTETEKNALPEGFPEGLVQRKTVNARRALFQARHEKCGQVHGPEAHQFFDSYKLRQARVVRQSHDLHKSLSRVRESQEEYSVEQQAPAGAQPVLADKNCIRQPFGRLGWEGGRGRGCR